MNWALFVAVIVLLVSFTNADDDLSSESVEELRGNSVREQQNTDAPKDGFDFRTFQDKQNVNKSQGSNENVVDYEEELKLKQAEAMRQRKVDGRKQDGVQAVKRTITAASSDTCDWIKQPLSFIKGEVCGSHYKVLGIDRKSKLADKAIIKKKYRQLSLQLHPDKNPAPNAQDAFNVLQGAYDCILDESCKEEYDQRLIAAEEVILEKRLKLKKVIMDHAIVGLNQAHYYVSIAANRIYQLGLQFWDMAGEWQLTVFDESYPVGRPLAILVLLWKGQFLLKLHALSYVIIRINYEIAKARGWL